jgi:hypothetical protein
VNTKRVIAIAAATLVAGLVIGQMSGAFAARSTEAPVQNRGAAGAACEGSGLKLGPMMRDAGGRLLDIVADLTGLTTEEVAEQRAGGASISDIAASEGVEADAVVDAALDARKTALEELVADGTITQEQADEMLERMSTRLSDRITSTETGRNGCGAGVGRGSRGGGRGQGGGFCGACPNGQ